jgi:AraC-like DNA-binding protein
MYATTERIDQRSLREPDFFSRQITEARRFFLQLEAPWDQPIVAVCGGSEHCTSDYRVVRNNFHFLAVEFVARGEGELVLNGRRYDLMPGAVFAYGPGVAHDMRSSAARPLVKYFVNFAGVRCQRWMQRSGGVLAPGILVQTAAPEHLLRLFEELIDAGRRETPFRPAICRLITEQMLLRIAETAVPPGTIGTEAFETFERCRGWIEMHYRKVANLEQIGGACHVNSAYLCRLFKRFAHQSPWQFVLALKMRDAAHRLQSTHMQVGQVAYEFGFDDPFQFSRTFRRVFGISPRRFVQLQRRHG